MSTDKSSDKDKIAEFQKLCLETNNMHKSVTNSSNFFTNSSLTQILKELRVISDKVDGVITEVKILTDKVGEQGILEEILGRWELAADKSFYQFRKYEKGRPGEILEWLSESPTFPDEPTSSILIKKALISNQLKDRGETMFMMNGNLHAIVDETLDSAVYKRLE